MGEALLEDPTVLIVVPLADLTPDHLPLDVLTLAPLADLTPHPLVAVTPDHIAEVPGNFGCF